MGRWRLEIETVYPGKCCLARGRRWPRFTSARQGRGHRSLQLG